MGSAPVPSALPSRTLPGPRGGGLQKAEKRGRTVLGKKTEPHKQM